MIAKVYNALAIVAIANMLALGGFAGFLIIGGKLTPERAEAIASVLRGEMDEAAAAEEGDVEGTDEGAAAGPERRRSGEEVRMAREHDRMRHLEIERARRDVEARQQLLDQSLHDLVTGQEEFTEERQAWTKERAKLTTEDQDRGFEQELEYVAGLAPKQAKEHLILVYNKHSADAVRLLMHMDVSRGKRILAQFKTPEELQIMSQLLEQLRNQDEAIPADESGTTAGDEGP